MTEIVQTGQLHVLDTAAAREYADGELLLSDLVTCKNYLTLLLEIARETEPEEDDMRRSLLKNALWNSAVIAYARCFASGVRRQLTDQDIDAIPGDGRVIHERVIHMRNKHIAHSVNSGESVYAGPIISEEGEYMGGVGSFGMREIMPVEEFISVFRDLITFLIRGVETAKEAHFEALRAECEASTVDELRALPSMTYVVEGPAAMGKARKRLPPGPAQS